MQHCVKVHLESWEEMVQALVERRDDHEMRMEIARLAQTVNMLIMGGDYGQMAGMKSLPQQQKQMTLMPPVAA